MLGLCLPIDAPADAGFRLTLLRPSSDKGIWRVYAAHREWEFTYACDLPHAVVEALVARGLLEEAEAGGRLAMILSPAGAQLARALRTHGTDDRFLGKVFAERGAATH